MMKRIVVMSLFFGAALIVLSVIGGAASAQEITNTPAPLSFPTSAPQITPLNLIATSFPTFTPTVEPIAIVRLKEGSSSVNVRAEPDDRFDNIIGQLRPDEEYTLTGIWYSWYEIAFGDETGYVFGSIVDVVGDIGQVPLIELATYTPALSPAVLNPTLTYEAIFNSEGGEMTLTASARVIEAPGVLDAAQILPGGGSGTNPQGVDGAPVSATEIPLPTFTYPPNLVAQAQGEESATEIAPELPSTAATDDGVAPIIPIAVLALSGVLFFLLGLLQR